MTRLSGASSRSLKFPDSSCQCVMPCMTNQPTMASQRRRPRGEKNGRTRCAVTDRTCVVEGGSFEEKRVLDLLQPALAPPLLGALRKFPPIGQYIRLHQIKGAKLAQHLDDLVLRGSIRAE